jgi:hypothetical protein
MEVYNYYQINKKIKKLKIFPPYTNKIKKYNLFSLRFLFFYKLLQLLKSIIIFFYEYSLGFKSLIETFKLRDSCKNKCAVVLGNGPSLNFLKSQDLKNFQNNGNDIFAVNYWNENKKHSSVIPNYLTFSDPKVFMTYFKKRNGALAKYVKKNKNIKILLHQRILKNIQKVKIQNKYHLYVDSELNLWCNNISPLIPRGYSSVTFLKALSFAVWLGYKKIFVLGFDNTYHRDIFCDEKNRIFMYENHTNNKENYLHNVTSMYTDVGDILSMLSMLFLDFRKFNKIKKIINVDPYSVNTQFKKKSIIKHSLSSMVGN